MASKRKTQVETQKVKNLEIFRERPEGEKLTSSTGLRINDDQNSLKAGERGPSLLEDFHLREKITHFDHERIPERVVHARGSAAHGFFQVYKSLAPYTKAKFLQDPNVKTPVFVRFSTVGGSRGSTDLARDPRGFAVKFYTEEGNYDLVGNNIPVFFIQDAIKFPDLVHAVKPEPHHEIPQASTAHDTFWDFISLSPESMHMVMWIMSDRAIPRSYRMMEGFGVHTFRLINEAGKARFVKFHWKPLLGVHSVVWDEALKISGKDPDFHRRDLWEAIENGDFPEYELGLQIVEEKDEHKFGFDLLDPTKLIPEELVPVQRVGKMTLNRNPDNFFAETEQVAFHPGHVVSGIDFSNDPLLQGRLFSYLDTQLTRLGGPNFNEIPINRPIAPVHNDQRDGLMRQTINTGRATYQPNSLSGGCPFQAKAAEGGFVSYNERIDGSKVRARSASFFDHFSQATMFWNSQSAPEKMHIIHALRFELAKVETVAIRERILFFLSQVDKTLATQVATGLGMVVPSKLDRPMNQMVPADIDPADYQPKRGKSPVENSAALSMLTTFTGGIKTRKVAILAADGFDDAGVAAVTAALEAGGAMARLVAPHLGNLKSIQGKEMKIDFTVLTASSVLFDALYIPGGQKSFEGLKSNVNAIEFVHDAYRHCKTIAATGVGVELLRLATLDMDAPIPATAQTKQKNPEGIIVGDDKQVKNVASQFVEAMAAGRHWSREVKNNVPV